MYYLEVFLCCRHLTELKAQIDEDDRRIKMLTEQETRLNEQITALIGQNNDVIGQVPGAIIFYKTTTKLLFCCFVVSEQEFGASTGDVQVDFGGREETSLETHRRSRRAHA